MSTVFGIPEIYEQIQPMTQLVLTKTSYDKKAKTWTCDITKEEFRDAMPLFLKDRATRINFSNLIPGTKMSMELIMNFFGQQTMGKDFAFYDILVHLRVFKKADNGMLVYCKPSKKAIGDVFARGKLKPEAYCVYMIFDMLRSDPFIQKYFDQIPMSVQRALHEHVDDRYYDYCVMMLFLIEIHENAHVKTMQNDENKERAARLCKRAMTRLYFPMLQDYILGKSQDDSYYQEIKGIILKVVYGMLLKNPAIRSDFKYYKFEQYLIKRINKLMVGLAADGLPAEKKALKEGYLESYVLALDSFKNDKTIQAMFAMKDSAKEDYPIHPIEKVCELLSLDSVSMQEFIETLNDYEMIENNLVCWTDLSEIIDMCGYISSSNQKLLRYYYRSIEMIYKYIIMYLEYFNRMRIDGENEDEFARDVSDDLVLYKDMVEQKYEKLLIEKDEENENLKKKIVDLTQKLKLSDKKYKSSFAYQTFEEGEKFERAELKKFDHYKALPEYKSSKDVELEKAKIFEKFREIELARTSRNNAKKQDESSSEEDW